jgi:hypothetical protein
MPTSTSAPPPESAFFRRQPPSPIDQAQLAEFLGACDADHLEVIRVVLAAIRDAELAVGGLARIDHLLAALRRDLHRLLAEHVLAGFGGGERLLEVQSIRSDDVNDVDVRVIRHLRHRVVGVDAPVRNAVLRLPGARLLGCIRDDAGQAAPVALLQGGRDLVFAQTPEPAHGEADLLAAPLCQGPRDAGADERDGGRDGGARDEAAA